MSMAKLPSLPFSDLALGLKMAAGGRLTAAERARADDILKLIPMRAMLDDCIGGINYVLLYFYEHGAESCCSEDCGMHEALLCMLQRSTVSMTFNGQASFLDYETVKALTTGVTH